MMICVNDNRASVQIGREKENLFRSVTVNVAAWRAELPGCDISAVFTRPDGVTYAVPLRQSPETVTWYPTDVDTLPGSGALELRVRKDEVYGKSVIIGTFCLSSITGETDAPFPDAPPVAEVGQVLTWTPDGPLWKTPQGVQSATVTEIVPMDRAEYEALAYKSPSILYLIRG